MNGEHAQHRLAPRRFARAGPANSARRPVTWLKAAIILALASVVGCQTTDTPQRRGRGVKITEYGGYIDLIGRRREQEQASKVGARDVQSNETIFEESVTLKTKGYVYHPNLLEFAAAGLFGLTQRDYDEVTGGRARATSDDGNLLGFDVSGLFLKKKKYPGLMYARRHEALEPRLFQSSLETTTTNYGVMWQYLSQKVPTRLQFNQNDVQLDPLDPEEEAGRQTNTNLQFNTGYNFSDYHSVSLTYRRDSVQEEPFELDYDSDELTLGHQVFFGDQRQHRLLSELIYLEQRGTFDIERAEWRETLRLQHTEQLRSWYRWYLASRTQGTLTGIQPIDETTYYLGGTVEHQLYESLISQLHAYLQNQQFESGPEIDRYGAYVSFDYRKQNAWGVLRARYRAGLERQDRRGGDQSIEVLDEVHTFRDPEPITLATPNIVLGSILITAEDRLTIYQRERDYRVQTVGDRVEIRRIPTGQIADGQTVLIDYVFELGGSLVLDSLTQDFELRQEFLSGLSPFYRLRWQGQTITPKDAPGAVPEDITAHTIGVDFQRGSLRLGAEYEAHDSSVSPFDALRLRSTYTHRFGTGATAILTTRWSNMDYDLPVPREIRLWTVEGRYRHPLTRSLTVEGGVVYRVGTDTLSGDDEGLDVDLALEWLIRQTEIRLTWEYAQFDDDFSRNDSAMIYVQVRRRF